MNPVQRANRVRLPVKRTRRRTSTFFRHAALQALRRREPDGLGRDGGPAPSDLAGAADLLGGRHLVGRVRDGGGDGRARRRVARCAALDASDRDRRLGADGDRRRVVPADGPRLRAVRRAPTSSRRRTSASSRRLVAAAALLIDYILTVAVSVASGVFAITSAVGSLAPYRVELSLARDRADRDGRTCAASARPGSCSRSRRTAFILALYAAIGTGLAELRVRSCPHATVPHPLAAGAGAVSVFVSCGRSLPAPRR